MLKRFAFLAAFSATAALAQLGTDDGWERATKVAEEKTPDVLHQRCTYETIRGLRFSILIKAAVCPYAIDVNPQSGSWRPR